MAEIRIFGEISSQADPTGTEPTVSAADVSNQLAKITDDKLTVRINSPGGEVSEGFAIYDILKNSGKKIKTIAEGRCSSIATIILLAGTDREATQNTEPLMHCPWTDPKGQPMTASDLENLTDEMKALEDKMVNFYASHLKIGKEEILSLMKEDKYISAEEAIKVGLLTGITKPIRAYAYINNLNKKPMDDKTLSEKVVGIVTEFFAKKKAEEVIEPKAMELTDKDGKVFKVEKETGEIATGDKASPDGEYVMGDGTKIVVKDGLVTIEAPQVEEAKQDEVIVEEAGADKQAELAKQLEELTAKNAELSEQLKAFQDAEAAKAAEEEAKKAKKSTFKVEARDRVPASQAKPEGYIAKRSKELGIK